MPLKLAVFSFRTLVPTGQQASLAHTLEAPAVDVFYQRNSHPALQQCHPIDIPILSFCGFFIYFLGSLRLPFLVSMVLVWFNDWAGAALFGWIPADILLCTGKPRRPSKVNNYRSDRVDLFAVSAFTPTGYSPDATKDIPSKAARSLA